MDRKFYLGVSVLAVVVVGAVALVAQGRLFKGDWSGLPLSAPVSATYPYTTKPSLILAKPLSVPNPLPKIQNPPWSAVKLTKAQVVKASASGQTILAPETLPLASLPAGNQQMWIKRIQFAYLIEKTIGYYDAKPISFPNCKAKIADYGTPRLYNLTSSVAANVMCFAVEKGFMPTLSAPVKNSFYGGQNISRMMAASMLQQVFDPNAAAQKPQQYYIDGGYPNYWWQFLDYANADALQKKMDSSTDDKIGNMYTDVAPYMWGVYWLAEVGASDVAPWTSSKFRPYDSLTIPEAMAWITYLYKHMPQGNWLGW